MIYEAPRWDPGLLRRKRNAAWAVPIEMGTRGYGVLPMLISGMRCQELLETIEPVVGKRIV